MRSQADPQSNRKSSMRLKPGLEEESVYLQPESDVGARGTRLYYNHLAFSVQKPFLLSLFYSTSNPLLFGFFFFYTAHARVTNMAERANEE